MSRTYESVHSLFPPKYAFQITVAKNHPTKIGGLKRVKKAFGTAPIHLCFVVPEDIYTDFRQQSYVNKDNSKSKDKVVTHFMCFCQPYRR